MYRPRNRISDCYARAFHSLVSEDEKKAKAVHAEANKLYRHMKGEIGLLPFLGARRIEAEEKNEALEALASECSETLAALLRLLNINNRLALVGDVLLRFLEIYDTHRGKVEATVISAAKLGKTQLASVTTILAPEYGSGVKLANTVDEEILGGIIVVVNHVRYDFSLRTELRMLSETSKRAISVLKEE